MDLFISCRLTEVDHLKPFKFKESKILAEPKTQM